MNKTYNWTKRINKMIKCRNNLNLFQWKKNIS